MNATNQYLVYGYFGGWNSGDEAILDSVSQMIQQWVAKLPGDSGDVPVIAAICSRLRPEFESVYREQGIRMLVGRDLRTIANVLKDHQLIVGGGQMITGDRSYKGLLFLYVLTLIARIRGRRAWMIGIGVEGVHRSLAKWLCRRIVANSRSVGCRDSYSLEMLRSAGCDEKRLSLTADVVLSGVLASEGRFTASRQAASRPVIAFGLHHSPLRAYSDIDETKSLILSIADAFPEHEIVLVSNDSRDKFDAGLLDQLLRQIDHPRIRGQHFDDVDVTISVYAQAACVVSVRMHPLILGLIHGVPVVGIDRSNKVKFLAQRVGFQLFDPDNETMPRLLEKVASAMAAPELNVADIANESWKNLSPDSA